MDFILSLNDFLEYDFLKMALLWTILVSICTGALSPIVVSKKMSFIGSALSHSTLLGIAIGFCFFNSTQSFHLYATTLITTLIIVTILSKYTYREALPEDGLIGIFLTSSMGLGILIHTLFSKEKVDFMSYLFGNILLVSSFDIIVLILLTFLSTYIIFKNFNTWVYISFDEESARISGINTKLYHHLFYFLLGLIITSSIKIAGTILVNSFLLMPGILALKISKDLKTMMRTSILFSLFTGVLGLAIANGLDLPLGATMASLQFLFFILIIKIKTLKEP